VQRYGGDVMRPVVFSSQLNTDQRRLTEMISIVIRD